MRQRTKEQDELRKTITKEVGIRRDSLAQAARELMAASFEFVISTLREHEDEVCPDGTSFIDGVTGGKLAGFDAATISKYLDREIDSDTFSQILREEGESRMILDFFDFEKMKMDAFRSRYPKSFSKWTDEDDTQLLQLFDSGCSLGDIAQAVKRNVNAVRIRLDKLGRNVPGGPGRPHYPISSSSRG